jgi:polar amino acid transport system substrate-binding protein
MPRRRALIATLLTLPPAFALGAPEMQWVAGDLPPWSWRTPAGPQGYAHDLVMAMMQRLGRNGTVSYFPWARAVRLTEQGEAVGVFPLARTPDREARFRWLIPLSAVRYVFLTAAADGPVTLDALRQRPVGVLRGSPIVRNLRAQRFTRVVEAKDYSDLLRMLSQRVIHAIYAGGPMLDAAIEQYGYERAQFASHLSLGESTLYIAASLRLPDPEAALWLKAYAALEEDGTVARLRRRYLR